jgi:DNA-nicking Smr family endonuclease
MLLIVTGKGARGGGEGVLRQALPRWLNMPDLRERVLAFASAHPRHGGAGAFYILLKRRRNRTGPGFSPADNGRGR